MASFVTSSETTSFTGDLQKLFDTFKRDIVIYKEPKKVIENVNSSAFYGYGDSAQKTNITYVPVFETHQATVSYKDRQESEEMDGIGLMYFAGDVRIKTDENGKNYIKNGKTEKIVIDGKDFNILTAESIKYFLGLRFYVFHLEHTK
jgi:hypothetical protein